MDGGLLMDEGDVQSFGQVVGRAFDAIRVEDMRRAVTITDVWRTVVSRIRSERNPNEGRNMASHSRVVDVKNGVMLVEADHPGWIELLQMYRKFILTGIRRAVPKAQVSTLAFRLAGRRGELFDPASSRPTPQQERAALEGRIVREEEALDAALAGSRARRGPQNAALPPELTVIFEDLRKSMLTNSKK